MPYTAMGPTSYSSDLQLVDVATQLWLETALCEAGLDTLVVQSSQLVQALRKGRGEAEDLLRKTGMEQEEVSQFMHRIWLGPVIGRSPAIAEDLLDFNQHAVEISIVSAHVSLPDGISTLDAFSRLSATGGDAATEIPASRWDASTLEADCLPLA